MSIQCPFCKGNLVRCTECGYTARGKFFTFATGGDDYEGMCPSCNAPDDELEEAVCPHCKDGVITLAVEEECSNATAVHRCKTELFMNKPKCEIYGNECKITRALTDKEIYAIRCSIGLMRDLPIKNISDKAIVQEIEAGSVTIYGLPVVIKKGE